MLIRKAYKFRLNVTQKQSRSLFRFTGCCRFLWNKCWYINKTRISNKQPIMRYQEMDFWSKLWKQSEEYGFLKECQSQLLQQKLKDLDKAFMDCFDKKQTKNSQDLKRKVGQIVLGILKDLKSMVTIFFSLSLAGLGSDKVEQLKVKSKM